MASVRSFVKYAIMHIKEHKKYKSKAKITAKVMENVYCIPNYLKNADNELITDTLWSLV